MIQDFTTRHIILTVKVPVSSKELVFRVTLENTDTPEEVRQIQLLLMNFDDVAQRYLELETERMKIEDDENKRWWERAFAATLRAVGMSRSKR